MNEFKGTPGPWSVKTRRSAFDLTVTIEDGVCGPDGEQIRVYGLTLSASKEAKANSHLVAASPELLAALRSALKTAEFERHPFRAWHQEARAAIAKATGSEP